MLPDKVQKLVDNIADDMSSDNPENHWFYHTHLEDLAEEIVEVLK